MSVALAYSSPLAILDDARDRARQRGLAFAGELAPAAAWDLAQAGVAVLVDVRSFEEYKFVGHVPGSINLPWATGADLTRNPGFARELQVLLRKDDVILFLCRSAKRSAYAAELATALGFENAFNVLEGFEGERDAAGRRGSIDGWRLRRLPWVQD